MFLDGIESQLRKKNRLAILGTSSTTNIACPRLRVGAARPRQRLKGPVKGSMDSLACPSSLVPMRTNAITFSKKLSDERGYDYKRFIS